MADRHKLFPNQIPNLISIAIRYKAMRSTWKDTSWSPQLLRVMQNSTASSSASFIGEAGNSASASVAMAP
jgi:hypothetical protein